MSSDDDKRLRRRTKWPSCAVKGCLGRQADAEGLCLKHMHEDQRKQALALLGDGRSLALTAGVSFTEELLAELLAALPRSDRGGPLLHEADFRMSVLRTLPINAALDLRFATLVNARFDEATFRADVWFGAAIFQGNVGFSRASFQGDAVFAGATFQGDANFDNAHFQGGSRTSLGRATRAASFDGATFHGDARFTQVTCQGDAGFYKASFKNDASFHEATFKGDARFDKASFKNNASFDEATFWGDARLTSATFVGPVSFVRTQFFNLASFKAARFDQEKRIGPLLVGGTLDFDQASFAERLELDAIASAATCTKTQFSGGMRMEIGFADVTFEDTQFGAPSRLAAAASHGFSDEEVQRISDQNLSRPNAFHPHLLSLRGTDVDNLRLSNVQLQTCAFTDAHNLADLRLERVGIPTPAGWHVGWAWPPMWRWTRRAALAEEHAWRTGTRKGEGWTPPPHLTGGDRPDPRRLAAAYRRLREGREAAKDEPGAEGFYYGEMEMRRLAPDTSWGERLILQLYWFASGYGLRGLRALGLLLACVLLAAMAIHAYGYIGAGQSWPRTLVYAAGAATRLITPPNNVLNDTGQAIRILMGLLGPLLLGLAVLAVRNRVKR